MGYGNLSEWLRKANMSISVSSFSLSSSSHMHLTCTWTWTYCTCKYCTYMYMYIYQTAPLLLWMFIFWFRAACEPGRLVSYGLQHCLPIYCIHNVLILTLCWLPILLWLTTSYEYRAAGNFSKHYIWWIGLQIELAHFKFGILPFVSVYTVDEEGSSVLGFQPWSTWIVHLSPW